MLCPRGGGGGAGGGAGAEQRRGGGGGLGESTVNPHQTNVRGVVVIYYIGYVCVLRHLTSFW